jgi:uncharacterized oxidoreductase
VIGVGGGALLDSAKVIEHLKIQRLSGVAVPHRQRRPRRAGGGDGRDGHFLVLVEPRIILNAPAEYLLAGIGDTLAKWYEAVVRRGSPARR